MFFNLFLAEVEVFPLTTHMWMGVNRRDRYEMRLVEMRSSDYSLSKINRMNFTWTLIAGVIDYGS